MSSLRIGLVDKDLAAYVENLTEDEQRRIVQSALSLAVDRTRLKDPRISLALATLEEGRYGDTPECAAVARLVEELDERAWTIEEDRGQGKDYAAEFARARAASAVLNAFNPDARTAVGEALYEAHFAIDDLELLRSVVRV